MLQKTKIKILLIGLLPFAAWADVNLKWDLSSPPTVIKANNIYCTTSPTGPWALAATMPGGANNTGTVPACAATGVVYFVVRAVNFGNLESANSNVASVNLTELNPPVIMACPTVIVKMTVAPRTGYTDRPLFLDITRKKEIGRIITGSPCEDETLQKTTAGEWRWATNNTLRGVVLCK